MTKGAKSALNERTLLDWYIERVHLIMARTPISPICVWKFCLFMQSLKLDTKT